MLILIVMATFLLHRASFARPLGVGLLTHTLLFNQSARKARCDSTKFVSTTGTLLENPLSIKDGIPKFKEIKAEHVVPAVQSDLDLMKEHFKSMHPSCLLYLLLLSILFTFLHITYSQKWSQNLMLASQALYLTQESLKNLRRSKLLCHTLGASLAT